MTKLLPAQVLTYLNKNGVGPRNITGNTAGINCCIAIPSLNEFDNLKILLNSLAENDNQYFNDSLFLFIVNNTADAEDTVKQNNIKTLAFLEGIVNNRDSDFSANKIIKSGLRIAFIDAASAGKELDDVEGGVGLARKIAMDEALKIFNYNCSATKLLVCLDADCTVDKNYLTEIRSHFNSKKSSAAVVNYRHNSGEDNINTYAIICYEIYLRYYELALRYAKSPYAFHTIGSTMACDVASYIKAEGMNKRKAAEDFYFLSKLSKFCKVEKIDATNVYPSSRESDRVPFGTGQRVSRYLSYVRNEYELYNPEIFRNLKLWNEYYLSPDFDENNKAAIPASIDSYLRQNNFYNSFARIKDNSKTARQLLNQKTRWFDAFRTLKYIHYAKDEHFENINMFKAVEWLLKENDIPVNINEAPSIDEQRDILNLLRNL